MSTSPFLSQRALYFVKLAEHRSITEAASRIGLTQAALSRAMQQLEDEVGTQLLERRARGVQLTRAGAAFLEIIKRHREQMTSELSDALGLGDKTVHRVATVAHFGVYQLVPLLSKLKHRLPRVQLSLTWSLDAMVAVKDGRLPFAFVAWTKRPEGVHFEPIQEDPSAVVGLKSKYGQLTRARSLADIEHLPWIAQPKPQLDWTRALPIERDGFVVRDFFAFRHLVLSGAGVADIQLDMFSRSEKAKLAVAKHLPSRYQNEMIYAVWRDDIRSDARHLLETLLGALKR